MVEQGEVSIGFGPSAFSLRCVSPSDSTGPRDTIFKLWNFALCLILAKKHWPHSPT